MYPLILSFETINKLKLFFECGILRPQEAGHLCFRLFFNLKSDLRHRRQTHVCRDSPDLKVSTYVGYCKFFNPFYNLNVPPDAGLQKRVTFPH
jgi:hypothetical protein